jgi:flavin reductase (DIM6/NTAB) family NADH-FMN oxidoreductase RutF
MRIKNAKVFVGKSFIPADIEFDSKILGFCGTKSGRDTDKFAELGLEAVDSDIVSVPGIRQLPLTLECKVLSSKIQNIPMLPENIQNRYYPKGVDSSNPGSNEDFHIAYYGEIVNAYLITD